MYLLKLDAIDSTNSYLRQLSKNEACKNWTVVSAEHQTEGRGQKGATWESERSKNLMGSALIKLDGFYAKDHLALNWAVSLGIFKALEGYDIPKLRIKWPNDIMSGGRKLGGILIENNLVSDQINQCIVGFGINVNQDGFSKELPLAVSMLQITGNKNDKDKLLDNVIKSMQIEFEQIHTGKYHLLKQSYESQLYRKDRPAMFKEPEGKPFLGMIRGVTDRGLLILEKENHKQYHYDFKEIIYL